VLIAVSLVPVAIGLATATRRDAKPAPTAAATDAPTGPPSLRARAAGQLPFGMQRAAAAVATPKVVTLLGGLDSSDKSRTNIQRLQSGQATALGALQAPVHDAAAVALGSDVYLFGGGSESSSVPSIIRVDPNTGHSQLAGSLPQPSSDLAAAAVDGTAYLVGGFTGQVPLDTILAWRPGSQARIVGKLPQPLRYASVAAVQGKVLIAGGDTPRGPTGQVLLFDPKTGQVSPLATLPHPLSHAAAAALGGFAYLIGGRGANGNPTREITSVDPSTGATAPAGEIPQAMSDSAAAAFTNSITVAGGRSTGGVLDNVLELTPAPRTPGARGAAGRGFLQPGSDPSVLPGNVLIADRANNRLLEVTPQGKVVWGFPRSGDLRAGQSFLVPDDAFYANGGRQIVATQEDNFAISVIDTATHQIVYRYGHPGVSGSSPGYVWNPDDAIQLRNGNIIAADIKNCRLIQLRAPLQNLTAQVGSTGGCSHDPPNAFGSPNGAFPLSNGGIVVTEINGDWVDVFDSKGKLVSTTNPPGFSYPSDTNEVSPGVYLSVDYAQPGAIMEFDAHGKVLWRYSPSGRDQLNHPSLALPLPNGDVLVNDDYNHRVIVVDPKTNRIVWQYGHTGVSGTAPGYLSIPDGVDLATPHSLIDRFPSVQGLPGH
jgi:outer membrane protein assembly factor BamB